MDDGFWQALTSAEIGACDPDGTVVVLPVGAVEQHGPHLPLATDAIIGARLVERLLARGVEGTRMLALPMQSIGHSLEHTAYPGTLTIAAETLLAGWLDVAGSVARAGLRRLVILNSHGGQTALVDLAALRLRERHGMLVARASYFDLGTPPGLFEVDELAHGFHGGEVETSMMLHLRPDLVRTERLADFAGLPARMAAENAVLGVEGPIGIGWMSQDLHPDGVCGNAARADAVRGEALVDHLVERLATLVSELVRAPLPVHPGEV